MSIQEQLNRYKEILDEIEESSEEKIPRAISMNHNTFKALARNHNIPDESEPRLVFGIVIWIDNTLADGELVKWFSESDFLHNVMINRKTWRNSD